MRTKTTIHMRQVVVTAALPIVRFVIQSRLLSWYRSALKIGRELIWRSRLGGLGENFDIYASVVIHSPDRVQIGDNVSIAEFVHVWGGGGVSIGSNVLIASHTVITSQTHDLDALLYRDSLVCNPVTIGDNVWIGSGAIIMPGVTIGQGAVIGAGSVVTKDIADRSVVAGVPARTIRILPCKA